MSSRQERCYNCGASVLPVFVPRKKGMKWHKFNTKFILVIIGICNMIWLPICVASFFQQIDSSDPFQWFTSIFCLHSIFSMGMGIFSFAIIQAFKGEKKAAPIMLYLFHGLSAVEIITVNLLTKYFSENFNPDIFLPIFLLALPDIILLIIDVLYYRKRKDIFVC